jgi:phospholipid/cholesterol/gamma-HCH transport system substrate-binding protein
VRWLSRVISIAFIVVLVAAVALVIRSKMPATHVGQSFRAWALFRDGSRLAVGSPVMIAGVHVGEVSSLEVSNGMARVDMKLRDDTDVPVDSWITKKAESAFGDSYLEIIPDTPEQGAANVRKLKSGDRIVHVIEGTSTDSALRAIAQTMPKIDHGLNTVHDVALSGRDWAHGTFEDRMNGIEHWLDEGHIERPLASADQAMERFENGTNRAADAVHGVNAKEQLDTIDDAIASARRKMKSVKESLVEGFAGARDGMDRIDPQVQQVADVMVAINQGSGEDWKGTLGRLVNEPKVADQIEDAAESVRDFTVNYSRFKAYLGLRLEYNVFSTEPRVYLTAEIRARNDKFYLVELEKGGLGGFPGDQLSDIPASAAYQRYQTIRDQIRFTAQFGKQFGFIQFRAGLKDSTPGIGTDILGGKLKLSVDLFGSLDHTPRLKITGAYEVLKSIYLIGGVDDALNSPHNLNIVTGNTDVPVWFDHLRYGRDYFLGGTLYFTDEDLALMIRVYGALLVSML